MVPVLFPGLYPGLFPGLFLVLFLVLAPAEVGVPAAENTIAGPIWARVLAVVDGDTYVVRARIWLGQEVETRVRLAGVDTPELTGGCAEERRLAVLARAFVVDRIGGREITLHDIQYGKYAGRVVARVRVAGGDGLGGDLAELLLESGYGRPYDGGRRQSWCGR